METTRKQAPRHWHAFAWALLTGIVIFLPFLIFDKGYFIYYGDFNVQQIPFYKLAHEAVRSGDLFWSWYTDLGANFVGSYSFYLLFSPFFWLTLPFPTSFLPHLMAPLLILKTACASLTACLYLRRFVRDANYAVIGGLLYAFSGWMDFNIFFNHFHEVAVFFPLLLLGVEKLVTEDNRGFFALMVMVNAAVNYWFFVGEAVFVILYVIMRRFDKTWALTLRKFLRIAFEAALGFGLAAFAVLPSVLALMGNPRTGSDELLSGWNVWLYWHEQRQPAILQSLFFPPELPARPNFLPDHGAKWASLSGWLPLFAMTGVLSYFFRRRNDWLKKLLTLCLLFAMVPVLNSLFILLNDSYYARWFYMPILLMAMATVRALEDSADDTTHWVRAIKWSGIILVAFTVMSGLTPHYDEDGVMVFGLADNLPVMWTFAAVAMTCLLLTAVLIVKLRDSRSFASITLALVMGVSACFTIFYIANGKNNRERSQWIIDHMIDGREQIHLPDDVFARSDAYDATDNILMYWHLPNIQAFHSIVPPSIMEFYPEVGVTRDVGSRPEADFYALRPLLSVRWLFIEDNVDEQEPMPGYTMYDHQNGFNVYENENFLPMGFTYDHYVTRYQMEDVVKSSRSNLMLRAVVLDEETAERHRDILTPMPGEGYQGFDEEAMVNDVADRRVRTAENFRFDNRGFTFTTNFEEPELVFLSVPWEGGWSARMMTGADWSAADIERVNIGFMGIRVPAGQVTVRFDYETPGLKLGFAITGGLLVVLALYLILFRRRRPVPKPDSGQTAAANRELLEGKTVNLTEAEFSAAYGDKEARAENMRRVMEEAAAKREALGLTDEESLHFTPPPEGEEKEDSANNPGESGNTN